MKRSRTTLTALVGLLLASALAAATLERARELLAVGDLDGARREAAEIVAATAGHERAAALDLLGSIAVEAGRWEEAREAWTRLADEHPASPLAEQARTKLALLDALAAAGEPAAAAAPSTPAAAAAPVGGPTAAPAAPPAAASTAVPRDPGELDDRDEPGAPGRAAEPALAAAPEPAAAAEPPTDRDDAAAAAVLASPPTAGGESPGAEDPEAAASVGRPPGAAAGTPSVAPQPVATAPPAPAAGGDRDDPASAPVAPAPPAPAPATPRTGEAGESAGRAPGTAPSAPSAPAAAAPAAPEAAGRPPGARPSGAPPAPGAAPSAPPPPAAAAAPAPAPPPVAGTAVFLAGDGKPRKHFQQAAEQLMEFLAERGVAVFESPDGLAVFQEARAALPRYLEAAREAEAASLLYFEAQFGHRESIQIECLTADGASLWSEKVTGGLGLSDRKVNQRLMQRFFDKLEPRIGGPGLPVQ